jgi:hypothetical protein
MSADSFFLSDSEELCGPNRSFCSRRTYMKIAPCLLILIKALAESCPSRELSVPVGPGNTSIGSCSVGQTGPRVI